MGTWSPLVSLASRLSRCLLLTLLLLVAGSLAGPAVPATAGNASTTAGCDADYGGCQELRGLESAICSSRTTINVEGTSTMGWTGLTLWLAAISSEATWLSP